MRISLFLLMFFICLSFAHAGTGSRIHAPEPLPGTPEARLRAAVMEKYAEKFGVETTPNVKLFPYGPQVDEVPHTRDVLETLATSNGYDLEKYPLLRTRFYLVSTQPDPPPMSALGTDYGVSMVVRASWSVQKGQLKIQFKRLDPGGFVSDGSIYAHTPNAGPF